jgi:hypothetical protein
MKILKKFEGYIDDKISNLKNIKKIVTFMEKYKIDNFIIGNLDPDNKYQFEYIEKNKVEEKFETFTFILADIIDENNTNHTHEILKAIKILQPYFLSRFREKEVSLVFKVYRE